MPHIFELPPFHLPRPHGQSRMFPFQGLHTCPFVRTDNPFALFYQCGGLLVPRAYVLDFVGKE